MSTLKAASSVKSWFKRRCCCGMTNRLATSLKVRSTLNGCSLIDQFLFAFKTDDNEESTVLDENTCKICMENAIDCVLLECGHMLTCTDCGKILSECKYWWVVSELTNLQLILTYLQAQSVVSLSPEWCTCSKPSLRHFAFLSRHFTQVEHFPLLSSPFNRVITPQTASFIDTLSVLFSSHFVAHLWLFCHLKWIISLLHITMSSFYFSIYFNFFMFTKV